MRRLLAAVVALAIAVAGCGHSGQIRVADPGWPREILIELNVDAEGKRVVIEMLSGEERQGVHLRASRDSTVWYAPDDAGNRTAVRTSQIAMVHLCGSRTTTRARTGFAIGAALGVTPMVISVIEDPGAWAVGWTVGVFGGLLCGGAGGAVGALVGRSIPHEVEETVTYVLNGPPPPTRGRWWLPLMWR